MMLSRHHGAELSLATRQRESHKFKVTHNTTNIDSDNNNNNTTSRKYSNLWQSQKERIQKLRTSATLRKWKEGVTGKIYFAISLITLNDHDTHNDEILNPKENNESSNFDDNAINNDVDTIHTLPSPSEMKVKDIAIDGTMVCPPLPPPLSNTSTKRMHTIKSTSAPPHVNMQTTNTNNLETQSTMDPSTVTHDNQPPPAIRNNIKSFLFLEIERCTELLLPKRNLLNIFKMRKLLGGGGTSLCPIVVVRLNGNEVGRTPPLKNTNNPIWHDECFKFPICDKCQTLSLEVWDVSLVHNTVVDALDNDDSGIIIDDLIGTVNIKLDDLAKKKSLASENIEEYELYLKVNKESDVRNTTKLTEARNCSCPYSSPTEDSLSSDIGKVSRETFRVRSKRHLYSRMKKRFSFLVEKPNLSTRSSELRNSFRISNPHPFRRKDIRDVDDLEDQGDFFQSTTFKAICLIWIYLFIGVLGYSYIFEKWTIRDSLYFAVVTFTTVGYGDLRPTTNSSKIFSCIFALMGIGIIGVALGYIGQNLVQAQVAALQRSERKQFTEDDDFGSEGRNSNHGYKKESFLSRKLKEILVFIAPITIMIILGSAIVGYYEDWTVIDSLYWCIITGTSVGFGDFVPRTNEMKVFSIIFIPISVGVISASLGRIANVFVEQEIYKANKKLLTREVTLEDLEEMNADGDGEVSLLEFVEHMLKSMNKVDQNLLDELHRQFEHLDADGSGGLQQDDLELLTERKLKERRKQALDKYKRSLLIQEFHTPGWGIPQIVPTT